MHIYSRNVFILSVAMPPEIHSPHPTSSQFMRSIRHWCQTLALQIQPKIFNQKIFNQKLAQKKENSCKSQSDKQFLNQDLFLMSFPQFLGGHSESSCSIPCASTGSNLLIWVIKVLSSPSDCFSTMDFIACSGDFLPTEIFKSFCLPKSQSENQTLDFQNPKIQETPRSKILNLKSLEIQHAHNQNNHTIQDPRS